MLSVKPARPPPQWPAGAWLSKNPIVAAQRSSARSAAPVKNRGAPHRAKLDDNAALAEFASTLEKVCVSTVESGHMTKDLALLIGPDQPWLSTTGFLDKVDENLQKAMA